LGPEDYPGSFFFISSQKRNKTHDLRLAHSIFSVLQTNESLHKNNRNRKIFNVLMDMLKKIIYEDQYGSPEITEELKAILGKSERLIYNVEDMFIILKKMINSNVFKSSSSSVIIGKQEMGIIHCWVDGSKPMEVVIHQ
jgi:hypothetical protein